MSMFTTNNNKNISLNKITDFNGINMKAFFRVFKIAIIFSIVLSSNINAQTLERHQAITAYIYNFANNIQWQNEEAISEFQFLIIGRDKDVFNEMKTLSNTKTLRGKPINIVSTLSVDTIDGVQLIYITKDQEDLLIELFDKIKGKNILLISDGFLDKRLVMINFTDSEKETLRFEINKANIINQNLRFTDDLVLFGGTEIDVAALYREGQQSLRSLQKHTDNLESNLSRLENTIASKTEEMQVLKDSLNRQMLKIQEQQKTFSNQSLLLEEKKTDIKTQNQKIQEQQNILDSQYNESEKQKGDLKKGNELLQDQQDKILSQTKILEEKTGTIDQQQNMLVLLVIITILVIVLVLLIYNRYKSKQKLNTVLETKVEERTNELRNANEKLFNELTERKLAEEALVKSEAKLNALFTSLTEMVVIHELLLNDTGEAVDYRIIDCNTVFTEFTKIRKEDAIGKLASEVYQSNPPPYLEKYAKVAQGGDPHEFTTYYPPLDKHFMISVVSPQSGKFATITTDISDMMQIQETIMAKNKEMENYLYIASHDLRAPLVNIQGFSQRLKKQADSIKTLFADKTLEQEAFDQLSNITDENIPKTLSFILGNIEKMDTLINGLLQLSRTGRLEMNIQKIDMNALFVEIFKSLDFQIKEVHCKIHINPLPDCYGDATLLDQLFANLISNALKYSDSERTLEITVEAKKTYNKVVYSVRDTGKGIAQKHLEKIWDIFYRIDPRSGKNGEGIGLSLVKRITEKHKGKIWVESEENKGSVFHVELQSRKFTEF